MGTPLRFPFQQVNTQWAQELFIEFASLNIGASRIFPLAPLTVSLTLRKKREKDVLNPQNFPTNSHYSLLPFSHIT